MPMAGHDSLGGAPDVIFDRGMSCSQEREMVGIEAMARM